MLRQPGDLIDPFDSACSGFVDFPLTSRDFHVRWKRDFFLEVFVGAVLQ